MVCRWTTGKQNLPTDPWMKNYREGINDNEKFDILGFTIIIIDYVRFLHEV